MSPKWPRPSVSGRPVAFKQGMSAALFAFYISDRRHTEEAELLASSVVFEDEMDTKPCPFCGEEIKAVAVRCKHCQADLSHMPQPRNADFDRGVAAPTSSGDRPDDFEQRFLDFAYNTNQRIDALSVAHVCKVPIADAGEKLEDMAAREVLIREVDEEGQVYFRLPGRPRPGAMVKAGPQNLARVDESTALVGLLVNLLLPGVGSLIAGKRTEGVVQLTMLAVGLPLCIVVIGFPLLFGAWVWALVTGIEAVNQAKRSANANSG